MPRISVFVKPEIMHVLERLSAERGLSVEELAERAIESVAISTLPGGYPGSFDGQYFAGPRSFDLSQYPNGIPPVTQLGRLDLGGTTIGMVENRDGSVSFTP